MVILHRFHSFKYNFTIVPILVGSLSTDREAQYGQLLSKYLADPHNLFVISSDFCHWGQRFRYTYYDSEYGEIYQSITKLDEKVIYLRDLMIFYVSGFDNTTTALWVLACFRVWTRSKL